MEARWQRDVLSYWFGLDPEQWWFDKALDADIAERFQPLWEEQRQCPTNAFMTSPREALAAIILFDQFPRNMFRNDAQSFATDPLALAIANEALERGFDERLSEEQRPFLYMPFQHSEDLDDQQRSVALFTALGDAKQLRFAKLHHDIIERFGRFPHRNAVLGREPRATEVAAGDVTPW